jgi:hypothetical protein
MVIVTFARPSQAEKEEDGLLGLGMRTMATSIPCLNKLLTHPFLVQLQCFGHDIGSGPVSCLPNAEMCDLRCSQAGAVDVFTDSCSSPQELQHHRLLDQAPLDGIAFMHIQPRITTLSESLRKQILLEPYPEYDFSSPSSPLPQPSNLHSELPSLALKRKLPPGRDLPRHDFHMRPSK